MARSAPELSSANVGESAVNPLRRALQRVTRQRSANAPAETPAPNPALAETRAPETALAETPAPAETAPAATTAPKQASKLDLAERAYKEVLDATKHQDDKVGRFLTAIAFLTTGAIALITTNPGTALARAFEIPNGTSHQLLAWATGAFLAFTIGSVALLLLCLSVPVRLPKYARDPLSRSHLFYSYIAARPTGEWREMWVLDEKVPERTLHALEDAITNDYVGESHNLAERTSAKYRHSYEASWLFVCALLFLGIAIYLRILTSLDTKGSIEFNDDLHLFLLVAIVSVHALLQVYTRAVHDIRSTGKAYEAAYAARIRKLRKKDGLDVQWRAAERDPALHAQRRRTPLSAIAPIGFSVAVAAPWPHAFIAPVVAGVTVLLGLWVTFDTWRESSVEGDPGERTWFYYPRAWRFPLFVASISAGVAQIAYSFGGPWQLVAIPLPVLVLGLFNTSRPARSHLAARKLVRKRAVETATKKATEKATAADTDADTDAVQNTASKHP